MSARTGRWLYPISPSASRPSARADAGPPALPATHYFDGGLVVFRAPGSVPAGCPAVLPAPDRLASPAGFSTQVGNRIGSIDGGDVVSPAALEGAAGAFGLEGPPATLSTEGAAAGGPAAFTGSAALTGSTAASAPVSGEGVSSAVGGSSQRAGRVTASTG